MSKWVCLIVLTLAVPASAATPSRAPRAAEASRLQAALDAVAEGGATGAVAEVVSSGSVWRGTSGSGRIGKRQPVPSRARFRAGSVTKAFVATAVLQLVAEGRLRLDDSVAAYVPTLVSDPRITIGQLLGHTSGIDDLLKTLPLNPPSKFLPLRWKTWTAHELAERGLRLPRLSEPGAAFHYSSTNYVLLGLVVERVTRGPYAKAVERRTLRPLRLAATELPGTDATIRGPNAHGYLPLQDGRLVDITSMNPSVMGAAGEVVSSARDLNMFFGALLGGRLVPLAQLAAMTTTRPTGTAGRRYGLGLVRLDLPCGVSVYGHDGDALGYSTWSFATRGGKRRATLSITWGRAKPRAAVERFLARALCP